MKADRGSAQKRERAYRAKVDSKNRRLDKMNKARHALHERRLKLDVVESKLRARLRTIEAKQVLIADRYNGLVYRIQELKGGSL